MSTGDIEKLVGRLYTAFVARDLTFFVSGGLVIAVVVDKPLDSIANTISIKSGSEWFTILVYLGASYILGILFQEIAYLFLEHIPAWWKQNEVHKPLVVQTEELYQHCSPSTMLGLERILFLKQIGSTQLPALIIVGVYWRITDSNPFPYSLLVVLIFLLLRLFFRMRKEQERIIKGLKETVPVKGPSVVASLPDRATS